MTAVFSLLTGCGDAEEVELLTPPEPSRAVHVSSRAEFVSALQSRETWIVLDEPIYFHSPSDAINLSSLVPSDISAIRIEGTAGIYSSDGGPLYRLYDGSDYLISAEDDRPWEFRLTGLLIDAEHGGIQYSGGGMKLEYMQNSVLDDLNFTDVAGTPFSFGSLTGGGGVLSTEIRNLKLSNNTVPGVVAQPTDLRWRGGWVEWGAGVEIESTVHAPSSGRPAGPVLIENLHLEGARFVGKNLHELTYRGGYHWTAKVIFTGTIGWDVECNGYFSSTGASGLWVNGSKRCKADPN